MTKAENYSLRLWGVLCVSFTEKVEPCVLNCKGEKWRTFSLPHLSLSLSLLMYYQISFQSQLWIHSRIIFYANHSSDKLLLSLVTLFPSTEIFLTIKYLGEIHVYYYYCVVNVTQGLHGWMGTKCIYPFPKISRHGALFDETFLHCITSDKIFSRCSVGHLPPNCNRVVFFWTFTTSPQFLHFEAFGGSWRFIECFGTV